jgi:c-di-GMP-binding flagellar brake protein YcgR
MLSEILSLGDKIDIKHIDSRGRTVSNMKALVSQLIDFVDFDIINIATPIVYGKIVLLGVGDNYNLCFYTSKGLYQCNCIVLSNHKENNTIVSVVRIITNLEKFQRRQYFRLECIHDIEYRVILKEEEILERKLREEDFKSSEERNECRKKLAQFEKDWIRASITDISGGGARFSSTELHNHGDKVRIKMEIQIGNDLRKMLLGADIVSSGRIINRLGVYEHRAEFNDITQKDREALIKYIFEQERRRRRNDKG